MRIILDTGVFYHPEALAMMRWYAPPVIVPAVVYAERRRQLVRDGRFPDELDDVLTEFGAIVEPLSPEDACRYTRHLKNDADWKRLARNAFIAGHVHGDDRLFTTNPDDFVELGVPATQIIEIPRWRERDRLRARGTRSEPAGDADAPDPSFYGRGRHAKALREMDLQASKDRERRRERAAERRRTRDSLR